MRILESLLKGRTISDFICLKAPTMVPGLGTKFNTIIGEVTVSLKGILGFALSLTITTSSWALTNDEKRQLAEQSYSQRGYDAAGVTKAKEAVDLYNELAGTTQGSERGYYLAKRAEALHFVGTAMTAKNDKIKAHESGMETAVAAIKEFTKADAAELEDAEIERLKKLPEADLGSLALAVYYRAANLGQWGQANGVTTSLGRWPEMRTLLENVIKLGKKDVMEYGPYRALGRAYFKIPGLFGGDNRKSEKYLNEAVTKTQVPGKTISRNGHNNVYHAEVLAALGQKARAKALLEELIATSAADAGAEAVPEYQDAQKAAAELLPRI
jgi:hypothetical protein